DVIFGLGAIARIEIESRAMFIDGGGAIFVPEKSPKRMNYTAYSTLEEPLISDNTSYYVQFPSDLNKIAGFAGEIIKGANTDKGRALKIENYFKTNYTYSLQTSAPARGINPIEDFLFNSKQGYCEHYATSMALMLRAVGIPSRIVTGFFGGERNKYGGYVIVRQSNAHSWVEAAIDGSWKRFDPTPPAPLIEAPSMFSLYLDSFRMKWYRYVVNFSSSDQKRLIEYISIPFLKIPEMPEIRAYGVRTLAYAFVIIISAAMLLLLLRRFRIYRYGFVTAKYLRFRNSLKRKGANIMTSSTPSDVMKEAVRLGMSDGLADFISLYERARFGGGGMNDEEKKRYRSML
ncbi:MAG: transglutaminase domain-containing protein, partial [Thermodesulfovibrionales bacterium]|nr:transglutaminase domain-containing protein [Thermodesulfovibrionales bacterium]